jgi:hypothetical protein
MRWRSLGCRSSSRIRDFVILLCGSTGGSKKSFSYTSMISPSLAEIYSWSFRAFASSRRWQDLRPSYVHATADVDRGGPPLRFRHGGSSPRRFVVRTRKLYCQTEPLSVNPLRCIRYIGSSEITIRGSPPFVLRYLAQLQLY